MNFFINLERIFRIQVESLLVLIPEAYIFIIVLNPRYRN
jgi:hypothetical protein